MANLPRSSPMVYESVPLPLGRSMCIRVIKILFSATPDFSDDIICDMRILDVDSGALLVDNEPTSQDTVCTAFSNSNISSQACNRIQYQALSYTWGDSLADWTIIINGSSFKVQENLWNFLHEARRCKLEGYLWIDAICINQMTVREKNHQVGMMREIYSRAEGVIVWLGCHSAKKEEELSIALEKVAVATTEGSAPRDKEQRDWINIIYRFGKLSYWRRAWIVQEYYLAKQKQIWYGCIRIDSKWIKPMVERYNASMTEWTLPYNKAAGIIATQEKFSSSEPFGTFKNLVRLFQDSDCGDRRDRVYALLPLLKSRERDELDICPDYSKSVTDIFLQLALRIIREWDWSQDDSPHEILKHLELMLRPNLQDRAVQMAILDSGWHGAFTGAYGRFSKEIHPCFVSDGAQLCVVDAKGCSVCHNKPVVSLCWNRLHIDEMEEFNYH